MSGDDLGTMYGDREIVVREGDEGDCMFAIQSGLLEVVRQIGNAEVRIGVLQKGDIFGEMAIFENRERSATVRTVGPVRLLTIDKKTFLRRIQEDPSLAFNLTRLLCSRVRRLSNEVAKLSRAQGNGSAGPSPAALTEAVRRQPAPAAA